MEKNQARSEFTLTHTYEMPMLHLKGGSDIEKPIDSDSPDWSIYTSDIDLVRYRPVDLGHTFSQRLADGFTALGGEE